MTQAQYLTEMLTWADGERMVPEAFIGGIDNVASHFTHWQRVSEELQMGMVAVEVGCGCGMSSRIYSLVTQVPLLALDREDVVGMSEQMYPTPGVIFMASDFNVPGWWSPWVAGGGFDAVICVDVLEHVEDPVQFIKGLYELGRESDTTKWIISAPVGEEAAGIENVYYLHHWPNHDALKADLLQYLPDGQVVLL